MSIDYELQEDVAVVTMTRPDRFNAVNAEMARDMVDSLQRAGSEARALVLTGAGKAFCSGVDLAALGDEYASGQPDLARVLDEWFHPVVEALTECAVPTVAGINGVAAGAGLGLALGCDIRIMARSAFFTSAFTAIGLIPDSGTTWLLPHMVGISRAIELTMTNRRMSADEAKDVGIVASVVDDDQVMDEAKALAATLSDMVPDSLVTTRRLIREAADLPLREALSAERAQQSRLGRTPEHLEGVSAFLEKRKPDFRRPV